MMKILIIKSSALGDIVQAFSVLPLLRELFPGAMIDWVVERRFAELVEKNPLIDKAIMVDTHLWRSKPLSFSTWGLLKTFRRELRKKKYDLIFDLQGNCKSSFALAQARGDVKVGFGKKTVWEWPNLLFSNHRYDPPLELNVREEYLFLVRRYLEEHYPEMTLTLSNSTLVLPEVIQEPSSMQVLVCPGSAWPNKQVKAEALAEFMQLLVQSHRASFLVIWGSEKERAMAGELQKSVPNSCQVAEKMTLAQLQQTMQTVDLVVSMDSLPLHLAGTTATPTFSIFGASSARKYRPVGPQHGGLQGNCPYGRQFERRCPVLRSCPTGSCIRDLTGRQLHEEFLSWWKNYKLVT